MTKTVTTRYDVAEHLRTPEEMEAYLEACLEQANGNAAFIAKALGDIARAKGMSQVARNAGLFRESLYKALSGERNPGFDPIGIHRQRYSPESQCLQIHRLTLTATGIHRRCLPSGSGRGVRSAFASRFDSGFRRCAGILARLPRRH